MKNSLSIFFKKTKRLSIVSISTFILASFFFISIAPLSIGAVSATISTDQTSPGRIYLNYSGEGGKQEGFVPNLMDALNMSIVGSPDTTSATSLSNSSQNTALYQGGAMQAIGSYSEVFYQEQPASFIVWAQDQYYQMRGGMSFAAMAAQVNPNESSNYAPGVGYNVLTPVIGLWEYSRNIVYGVYIIILIVIAFLVLLRQPLGGQEVITIANSLPSIIISIILVTFSYPICGLFIDAVYLGSNFAYNVLIAGTNAPGNGLNTKVTKYDSSGVATTDKIDIKSALQPDDPQMSIWTVMNLSGSNICNRNGWLSGQTTQQINSKDCSFDFIVPKQATNMLLGGVVDTVVKGISSTGVGQAATSVLIELILALAIFQTALKLFFNLLNSYLTLSIFPIVAPWIFLGAAIPNNLTKTLNDFFKLMGAACLNLIAIYACFLLLVILGQASAGSSSGLTDAFNRAGQIGWAPPLLGYSNQQVFDANSIQSGTNGGNIISSLLIFGLYMAIPGISDMIKKFLEVVSPFQEVATKTQADITGVGRQAAATIGTGVSAVSGKLFGK